MAKYLSPMWLWVAPVSGSIGLKHRSWGSELGSRLKLQTLASEGCFVGKQTQQFLGKADRHGSGQRCKWSGQRKEKTPE